MSDTSPTGGSNRADSRRRWLRASMHTAGAMLVGGCNRHGLAGSISHWSVRPASASEAKPGIAATSPARYSSIAKPRLLQPFADPDFGSRMLRITDARAQFGARVAMPAYSSTQAWNCDESRLILYVTEPHAGGRTGWAMFDGRSYRFLRFLDINPSDIEQFWWSRSNPVELLYISNYKMGQTSHCELTSYDVRSGRRSVLHDFIPDLQRLGWPARGPVRAGYPFANGGDNRIWGLGAGGIPNIDGYLGLNVFGFDRLTGALTVYPALPTAQPRFRVPTPRVSGRGWFWNDTHHDDADNLTWVLDGRGGLVRKLPFSCAEHVDSALSPQGHDLLVGAQFDTAVKGNLIVADLDSGSVRKLVGRDNGYGYPRTGSFTSCLAYRAPQWVAGATVGSPFGTGYSHPVSQPWTLLDQEVFVANLETGAVLRVAHHRSTGAWSEAPQSNYWAQPNVTISPTGTRILVQSDWGCANPSSPVIDPGATVDTYVIELPAWHAA